jgi:MFS transporter, DHA2 family, multidrug resistance protein
VVPASLPMPSNSIMFAGVPPQKNNAISGIANLSRNMGGDIGIAFVTTFVARRAQLHQARLTDHASVYDSAFAERVKALAHGIARAGMSSSEATHRALAILYRQLLSQAATLAYLDAIKVLGISTALMIPLLFLTRRPASTAAPAAH